MAKPKPAKSPRLHVDPVIGPSKQLPLSDLPLLKDVLQYCRLKQVYVRFCMCVCVCVCVRVCVCACVCACV